MKITRLITICATVVILLTSAAYVDNQHFNKHEPVKSGSGKGFAVLELFTSEGCSSCPPADELLERIQEEAGNKPIYVLSYHVDYWNRLGWRDIFSNPDFSKRQYWYQRKFTSQVYTPQLIVNGTQEFVGSDERAIRNSLSTALNEKASTALNLKALQQPQGINIHYQLASQPTQGQLVVALVQKHAVNKVKAGENKGRTLNHAQIVRQLHTFSLSPQGQGDETIVFPKEFNSQNWELIGFIQNPDTGEILAAAKASVSSPSAIL